MDDSDFRQNQIHTVHNYLVFLWNLHYMTIYANIVFEDKNKKKITTVVVYSSDIKDVITDLNCGSIKYNINVVITIEHNISNIILIKIFFEKNALLNIGINIINIIIIGVSSNKFSKK